MKHGAVQTSTNKIKQSVAIKPLDGPVVNLSNWGFEWAGKSTWQLEQDHQMWSTLQRFILRDKYSAPVYSLVSQPLVLPRVVLVRAAASSGSIATVSWLQLVTWSCNDLRCWSHGLAANVDALAAFNSPTAWR